MQRVLFCVGLIGLSLSRPAQAQITIDGSLKTSVSHVGNDFTIINGTARGSNLFHSFGQFSIPTGGSATFDLVNTPNISTIFSRVTGGIPSNIDGTIRTLNGANPVSLFLLNPSGILFGANASLNIGGSFVGSTANSIKFVDGVEFSAANAIEPPLLTISAPIGLQFGQNPGTITHQSTNFAVQPGQELALVGGNIAIEGGSLSAPAGQIALGSVAPNSTVSLTPAGSGWAFGYGGATGFQDIQMTQGALVDASGDGAGDIQVQGRKVSLIDGSILKSNTLGSQAGIGVRVQASEALEVIGTDPGQNFPSSLTASVLSGATGPGGNIAIATPSLLLQDGGQIVSRVRGAGNAGTINLNVGQFNAIGTSADLESFASGIVSRVDVGGTGRGADVNIQAQDIQLLRGPEIRAITRSSGDAGNMTVRANTIKATSGSETFYAGFSTSTGSDGKPATGRGGDLLVEADTIQLLDGSAIRTGTGNSGNAGNLTVRARQIEVSGIDPVDQVTPSRIFTSQYGSQNGSAGKGMAGALTIETQTLLVNNLGQVTSDTSGEGSAGPLSIRADQVLVRNGGQISTATTGQGNAGILKLQANTLDVQGSTSFSGSEARSGLFASTGIGSTGQGGNIEVTAQQVKLSDRAIFSVSGDGTGNAGNLIVNAPELRLDGSSLEAKVSAGSQGNIALNNQVLLLRHGSNITTNASGNSSGGNIEIVSPIIVGLENSDITANALQGQGGNIQITTQGMIGLKYRDRLTPDSDITASSQFGVNGTVQINNIGVDPNSGLVQLPANIVDPTQKIAQGCTVNQGSSFVVTGRGGVPANPAQQVNGDRSWADLRDFSKTERSGVATQPPVSPPLVEATTWKRDPITGKVELIATRSVLSTSIATCAPTP